MLLRTFKRTLVMLLVATGMTGCVTEYDGRENPMHSTSGELKITVNVPGQLIPTTRSIAGSGGESVVKNIHVLVFDGSGVLLQSKEGTIITPGGNDFKCQLGREPNARTVVIVANVSNVAEKISGKSTKKDILAVLTHGPTTGKWNTTNSTNYTAIPMYGEKTVPSGLVNDTSISVELTRMLARVDVVLESTIPAGTFTLDSVYVVNYNTVGNIAPSWDTNGNLTSALPNLPGSPGKKTGNADALGYKYSGTGLTGEIYLYEAEANASGNPMTENPAHTNAICLIVKGKYSGTNYYYRIDFTAEKGAGQKPEDVQYMPVYRNYQYIFQISEVNGPGYKNFNDALKSFGVLNNLKTKLNTVNIGGITNMVFDGQHYIGLGNVVLDYSSNSVNVPCVTNYVGGWEIEKIEYVGAKGWLTADPSNANEIKLTPTVNSRAAANAPVARTATVHIKAGRLSHKMEVVQIGGAIQLTASRVWMNYFDHKGFFTSPSTTIKSYAILKYADGTEETSAVPWIAEFSTDNGQTWSTDSEWLTFPTGGSGGEIGETYTAVVQPLPIIYVSYNEKDLELRSKTSVGTTNAPYDLSTKGATPTTSNIYTANCYVLNAAGYYKLPLVYGNAIKGSKNPNTEAYNPTPVGSSSSFLKPFKNHADANIIGPYIYNHATPYDAVIIWMDWPELITNVRLTDKVGANYTYLAFDVAEETLAQGNAVVAVRDEAGTILWSWHIWVTAPSIFNVSNPVTVPTKNKSNVTYNFMEYNLGWCTARTVVYGNANREILVRLTQPETETPRTVNITIRQYQGIDITWGNSPYWQWGRKDPLPPSEGGKKTGDLHVKPTVVYGDGYSYKASATGTLGMAIKNPLTFYYSVFGDWCSTQYDNLWSGSSTVQTTNDNTVIKTVYDPSPVGFTLPAPNAWSNFVITNMIPNATTTTYLEDLETSGYNFYITGTNGNTAFYPAAGNRALGGGNIFNVTYSGSYWSAGGAGDLNSYCLDFTNLKTYSSRSVYRHGGYSVRSALEK